MRTKALLLGALIGAASLATSMAQVYSVNIVGYINIPIYGANFPGKWNLIANQLDNAAGNSVGVLMPNPGEERAMTVYTYDHLAPGGGIYANANWDGTEWDDPSVEIKVGYGAWVLNIGTDFTLTLVGEVKTGPQTHNLVDDWQLIAPIVPQAGLLSTDLGYVPDSDTMYTFDNLTQMYGFWFAEGNTWDEEPTLGVGQAAWIQRLSGGSWTRTFNVGP
jgi:hypothetical protein